ncbi:ABC transporter permease [Corynebacterium sp. UBA2622]|uniref:ABC transporter permease n=1 Tax=Corynebacterium sp. UBA2622 TaxID=1946393 RepID=UPI0025BC6F8C|nr:ABC transporter permease [Corynebacterium sp. UBA2622]
MKKTATVKRILAQLKNDPRTVALILLVPAFLLSLLYFVFMDAPVAPGQRPVFDRIGPLMLAILPLILMSIVTSVVMLRERGSGTLERIFTTPITRLNLLLSYAAVFGALAVIQSLILSALLFWAFDVSVVGHWSVLVLLAFLSALIGIAFGLLASAFARNEFQAVQLMPVFVAPQIFLCGLFVPTENMPKVLDVISAWLPMTWAVDVALETLRSPEVSSGSWWRIGALGVAVVVALIAAAASMPRKTA